MLHEEFLIVPHRLRSVKITNVGLVSRPVPGATGVGVLVLKEEAIGVVDGVAPIVEGDDT